jgi:hypothetical protein
LGYYKAMVGAWPLTSWDWNYISFALICLHDMHTNNHQLTLHLVLHFL